MDTLQTCEINGKLYYNSKDMMVLKPEFYIGCKTRPRTIIGKKGIPINQYIYANQLKGEWNISTEESRKANLFISKEWVDIHYFNKPTTQDNSMTAQDNSITTQDNSMTTQDNSTIIQNDGPKNFPVKKFKILKKNQVQKNTQNVLTTQEIKVAPNILELEDHEKFRDKDGNICEIETRGERHRKHIYFKVIDITKVFDMPYLNKIICRERGYERGEDYEMYYVRDPSVNDGPPSFKKCLFLTYDGLIRVLIVSRNQNENRKLFQDWAFNTLFTVQLGTKLEKQKLGTKLLNITIKEFEAVFSKSTSDISAIYLFKLGIAKDLRETFHIDPSIPDEYDVFKFGHTQHFNKRFKEHQTTYGKMSGVSLELIHFHIIDPKYSSNAETDVSDMFKYLGYKLNVPDFNELVAYENTKETKKYITKQYKNIGDSYIGNTAGLQKEIEKLKEEIKEINHKYELQQEKYEKELQRVNNEKELQQEKYENQLKDKDLYCKDQEIMYLKKINELSLN